MSIAGIEEVVGQTDARLGQMMQIMQSGAHESMREQVEFAMELQNTSWGVALESLEHSLETKLSKEMAERSLSKLFDQFSTVKKLMDSMG